MNEFMNKLYGSIGSEVTGYHQDIPFHGKIVDTRVKYGGDIQVVVETDDDVILIDGTELLVGDTALFSNLHVYFK